MAGTAGEAVARVEEEVGWGRVGGERGAWWSVLFYGWPLRTPMFAFALFLPTFSGSAISQQKDIFSQSKQNPTAKNFATGIKKVPYKYCVLYMFSINNQMLHL